MTREELQQAAMEYCGEDTRLQSAFMFGADYAWEHPHWIPVEERLPEKDNEFEDYSKLVIVTNGKDFWKGMYNYGGEEWLTFDLWQIDDATHWMEIHPPRKEDKMSKTLGQRLADFNIEVGTAMTIDWQQVRIQAAIAAMQSIADTLGSVDYNKELIAKHAVELADALIEKLQKKQD